MGIAQWMGVLDTLGGLVQVARRFMQGASSGAAGGPSWSGGTLSQPDAVRGIGQLETRLAGVVVAALKEAFDRDSARMEMERAQLDAERRRADEALRAELRRQMADRLLGQLRMVAVMAVSTWALSAALGVWLPGMRALVPRALLGVGWACALGALAAAFAGWQYLSVQSLDTSAGAEVLGHRSTVYAPRLLIAAVALTGAGLLVAL